MKTCCKDAVGRFCPVCGTPLLDKKLSLKRLLELKDIMMVGQKGEVYTITMPYTTLAEFLGAFEVVLDEVSAKLRIIPEGKMCIVSYTIIIEV